MELIDSAVSNVLSSSRLLLKHPGAMKLSEWYPSSSQATTQIAKAVNSNGRLRITSNNLALGASSNFSISSPSLVYGMSLSVVLTTPADSYLGFNGWLFSLIQSIEITVSNSLMSNVVLTGTAMREYMLACCRSREERQILLETAGLVTGVGTAASASIPIGWLLGSGDGLRKDYPLDMSVLNGPIQVMVNWNTSASVIFRNGGAPSAVAALTSAVLTCCTTDLIDGAFSVRTALMSNPYSSYNIPAKYVSSVRETKTFDIALGVAQELNLNSAPEGMLEAIILFIRPTVEATTGDSLNAMPSPVKLKQLRLQYGGQDLFRAESAAEIAHINRMHFNGDDLYYTFGFASALAAGAGSAATRTEVGQSVIVIPLSFNSSEVMSGKHVENLPAYGGANLQLSFTVANEAANGISGGGPRDIYPTATPFCPVSLAVRGAGAAQAYTIEIVYVLSAIVEISNSTVDLQL